MTIQPPFSPQRLANRIAAAEFRYAQASIDLRSAFIELKALDRLRDERYGVCGLGFAEGFRVPTHLSVFDQLNIEPNAPTDDVVDDRVRQLRVEVAE